MLDSCQHLLGQLGRVLLQIVPETESREQRQRTERRTRRCGEVRKRVSQRTQDSAAAGRARTGLLAAPAQLICEPLTQQELSKALQHEERLNHGRDMARRTTGIRNADQLAGAAHKAPRVGAQLANEPRALGPDAGRRVEAHVVQAVERGAIGAFAFERARRSIHLETRTDFRPQGVDDGIVDGRV